MVIGHGSFGVMAPLMGHDVLYGGTVVTEHREEEACPREKEVGFEKSQKG